MGNSIVTNPTGAFRPSANFATFADADGYDLTREIIRVYVETVAAELGYTGDPALDPSPFFTTLHGYRARFEAR